VVECSGQPSCQTMVESAAKNETRISCADGACPNQVKCQGASCTVSCNGQSCSGGVCCTADACMVSGVDDMCD
jgi:hypothetical protein